VEFKFILHILRRFKLFKAFQDVLLCHYLVALLFLLLVLLSFEKLRCMRIRVRVYIIEHEVGVGEGFLEFTDV
jgi:hypothetical protein